MPQRKEKIVMAIHGMIDPETLDTTSDAVVLTRGAIKFDPTHAVSPMVNFTSDWM